MRDRSTGVPVDDDTIFSAQSMSKPVFAYRVMKLCEQGMLDLDAPLTKYTTDIFVKNDSRLKEVTARRVLSHTSGLPNWRSKENPLRISFPPGTKWLYSGEGYHYLQSVLTRVAGHTDESQCGETRDGLSSMRHRFHGVHGGDIDGWHSQSAFSPERKTGFVILTNGENGYSMIWNELLETLVGNFIFL